MLRRMPLLAGPVVGAVAGLVTAVFASFIGNPVQLAALPLAIALFALLVLDRKKLLILILAFRSAGDIVLDSTRFSLGGYQIGVGGVINAFVILIVLLLVAEKPHSLPKKAIAAWVLFLLAALVGVGIAPAKADAIRLYLALLSYFAIFLSAFYVVRTAEDFRYCIRVVLWSSVIPALYALVELATGGGYRADGLRLQSTFGHPNIFAFYLVLVISLTFYVLKSDARVLSPERRLGLNLYMLLLLALLLLTRTRSAWIACFAVFALYGLFFERRFLAYLVLVILVALLIPSVQERLLELGEGNEYVLYARLNSFAWRRLIWETSLQWMRPDHYLLGYGLGSFTFYSPVFFPLAGTTNPGAHSVFVQLLFETGITGLLAYLWLHGRLLWSLRDMVSLDRLGACISMTLVVVYLVISSADNMLAYLSFNWYFWFVVGAACSVTAAGLNARPEVRKSAAPGSRPGFREGTV